MPVEVECLLGSDKGKIFLKKVLALVNEAVTMATSKDLTKGFIELVTAGSEVRAIFEQGFKDVMCKMWRSISAKRYVTLKVRLPGLSKSEINTPEKKEKLTKGIAKLLGLSPSLIEVIFEEVDVRRLWSERARMMAGGKQ